VGGVDVQQLKQAGLQRWGLWDDGRVVAAGGEQPQAGQRLEDQPPGGLGWLADIQPIQGEVGGDGPADPTFDQAEDEQGQADHGDQRLDAPVGRQEHRRHRQRALEAAVAALNDLLALVAGQHLGGVGLGGSRLVSNAYQPSVACSRCSAAWSNHQARVGVPRWSTPTWPRSKAATRRLRAMVARRAWTLSTVG
jgi:hypothetical protein